MSNQKSYRESHLNKGYDYHNNFISLPHRAMVWRLEQKILDRILREFFPEHPLEYLDFACGTGRILEYMVPRVQNAVGVDVSQSMLNVARANIPDTTVIETDITREDVLKGRKFDLITAFRFFPNAEPALRSEALLTLRKHLKPEGILIFNNHRNTRIWHDWKLRNKNRLMSRKEVRQLLEQADMKVLKKYPLAILPFSDKRFTEPKWLVEKLEVLASLIPSRSMLAQNIIYVCQKH
ncbi:MAG: methyltransferase domain-containing protein [Desulfobacteraceae bacterium]|nr:methyltransferase domain-containing protein [Desulfobacteraceae bacterium]